MWEEYGHMQDRDKDLTALFPPAFLPDSSDIYKRTKAEQQTEAEAEWDVGRDDGMDVGRRDIGRGNYRDWTWRTGDLTEERNDYNDNVVVTCKQEQMKKKRKWNHDWDMLDQENVSDIDIDNDYHNHIDNHIDIDIDNDNGNVDEENRADQVTILKRLNECISQEEDTQLDSSIFL